MGFVICGALCHAGGGNEQGMAYQTEPGVSEAVMENNKFRYNRQCPLMARSGHSPTQGFTSALPPKADIWEGAAKRLLMTQSGHSVPIPAHSEAGASDRHHSGPLADYALMMINRGASCYVTPLPQWRPSTSLLNRPRPTSRFFFGRHFNRAALW